MVIKIKYELQVNGYGISRDGYSLTVLVQRLHIRIVEDAVLGIHNGNTDKLIGKIHIGIWYN